MKEKVSIKIITKYCFISFFSILAFTMQFATKIQRELSSSTFEYYRARIIESFFEYQVNYYLMIPFFICAYLFVNQNTEKINSRTKQLAIFFSVMLVLGNSFRNTNSWDWCFLDVVSFSKTIIAIIGFYFVICAILRLLYQWMDTTEFRITKSSNNHKILPWIFNSNRSMIKSMLLIAGVIFLVWLPILIISYPGGSCVDVSYQIRQALGIIPFTTQQSILHTLYLSLGLNLGFALFHSYNIGLFITIVVQVCLLILTLSYSIYRLMEQKVNKRFLIGILLIYCVTPIYMNLATMAIKDTLFSTAILWFVIELVGLSLSADIFLKNKKRMISFIVSAIFVTLLRNNGIYVILLTLIIVAIYLIHKRIKAKTIFCLCGIPIIGFLLITNLLIFSTNASGVTSKEMLSIPFQQTARYMKEYGTDITIKEQKALEDVFLDVDLLASYYDPNISDPIKNLYLIDATNQEIFVYLKTWFSMGIRHPNIYIEAFLNHMYGWFDPGSNNWIRYQGRMEIFSTPEYLGSPDIAMLYVFNFLNRLPILGLLENVGVFVWGMFVATDYLIHKKKKRGLLVFVPLYVSLLVCIASPVFWLHPRYAFPIILCMPFLWVVVGIMPSISIKKVPSI